MVVEVQQFIQLIVGYIILRGDLLDRNYWLELFTSVTWKEFQDAGSSISGFSKRKYAYRVFIVF